MRRSNGIAVIAAAAVLGVTGAAVGASYVGHPSPGGGPSTSQTAPQPPSTASSSTPAVTSLTSTATSPSTAVPSTSASPATTTVLATRPVSAANLLMPADLAAAGFDATGVRLRISAEGGDATTSVSTDPVSVCQVGRFGGLASYPQGAALEGHLAADDPVLDQVARTFASRGAAQQFYYDLVDAYAYCSTHPSESLAGTVFGTRTSVPLADPGDQAWWVSVTAADGARTFYGVLVVGSRVSAIGEREQARDPKAAMAALLRAAAARLDPVASGN